MGYDIITIGREFGSGGHKIGQIIAARLELPYYDKELLTLAAQRGGISEDKLSRHDEKKHNPYLYEVNYDGNNQVVKGDSVANTLYQLQKDTIVEIGKTQHAVIVGRCADDILKSAGISTLSVFVAAPFEARVKRTMALEDLDEKTVVALTKKKDKVRRAYYESRTGKKWGKPENYDMYFDTTEHDLNEIAERIIEAYQGQK